MLSLMVVISKSNPIIETAGGTEATQSGWCAVVYSKPKAVQSNFFHYIKLPLGDKGILDASLRTSEHKARRIKLY